MWCQCLNVTSIRPSSVVKLREDQVVADEVPVTVPVRTLQWLTGPMPPARHGRCGRRGRVAGSRAGGRGGRWSSRRTPSTWWRRRPQPMSCIPGRSTSWRAPTGSSPSANSGGWTPQTSAQVKVAQIILVLLEISSFLLWRERIIISSMHDRLGQDKKVYCSLYMLPFIILIRNYVLTSSSF